MYPLSVFHLFIFLELTPRILLFFPSCCSGCSLVITSLGTHLGRKGGAINHFSHLIWGHQCSGCLGTCFHHHRGHFSASLRFWIPCLLSPIESTFRFMPLIYWSASSSSFLRKGSCKVKIWSLWIFEIVSTLPTLLIVCLPGSWILDWKLLPSEFWKCFLIVWCHFIPDNLYVICSPHPSPRTF